MFNFHPQIDVKCWIYICKEGKTSIGRICYACRYCVHILHWTLHIAIHSLHQITYRVLITVHNLFRWEFIWWCWCLCCCRLPLHCYCHCNMRLMELLYTSGNHTLQQNNNINALLLPSLLLLLLLILLLFLVNMQMHFCFQFDFPLKWHVYSLQ